MEAHFEVQYRLAGNLFSNSYYINAENIGEIKTKAANIVLGMAEVQTADVEYISGLVTLMATPYSIYPLDNMPLNGNGGNGGSTAPAITFLEFVFYPALGSGKISHRIRGFAANQYTDLGVFNATTSGFGDPDSGPTGIAGAEQYASYLTAVTENSCSRLGLDLIASTRVSVGAKRATRSL